MKILIFAIIVLIVESYRKHKIKKINEKDEWPFVYVNNNKIMELELKYCNGSKEIIYGKYKHLKNNNNIKPKFVFFKTIYNKSEITQKLIKKKNTKGIMLNTSCINDYNILN